MYSPDICHDLALQKRPSLAFDETKDFAAQQKALREKLLECLGDMPEKVDPAPEIENITEHETYTERRISFAVEEGVRAVGILCIPKLGRKKYPLAICVQGHNTGMYISLRRSRYADDDPTDGDRDVAVQVLERGYAAFCLDQRGMGERRTVRDGDTEKNGFPRCMYTAMNALLVGRTLIGERCWDVSRAIDLALTYPEIDGDHILITGNSGGGTTSFYAACFDERIGVSMPSCAVCTYKDSIGAMPHCTCNYLPGIAKFADMGDLSAVIAPRRLVLIHGVDDPIFPDKGVRESYEIIRKVYRAAGVPDGCALATGMGDHRYYKKEAWEGFEAVTGGEWDA